MNIRSPDFKVLNGIKQLGKEFNFHYLAPSVNAPFINGQFTYLTCYRNSQPKLGQI